jgi:hypothetical protein
VKLGILYGETFFLLAGRWLLHGIIHKQQAKEQAAFIKKLGEEAASPEDNKPNLRGTSATKGKESWGVLEAVSGEYNQ